MANHLYSPSTSGIGPLTENVPGPSIIAGFPVVGSNTGIFIGSKMSGPCTVKVSVPLKGQRIPSSAESVKGFLSPRTSAPPVFVVGSQPAIESALAFGATMAANSKGMTHKDFRISRSLLGGLEG